jgi:hypothetical protein
LDGDLALNFVDMDEPIVFAGTCPRCGHEEVQDGFTVADLMRLLYGGFPIEAYCTACEEFWTVSVHKRVELGEMVAAAWGGPVPRKSADRTR